MFELIMMFVAMCVSSLMSIPATNAQRTLPLIQSKSLIWFFGTKQEAVSRLANFLMESYNCINRDKPVFIPALSKYLVLVTSSWGGAQIELY